MSRDMVTSHVETLIERVTGTEKAAPDHDGDYPVRYDLGPASIVTVDITVAEEALHAGR